MSEKPLKKIPVTQAPFSYLMPLEGVKLMDFLVWSKNGSTCTLTPNEIEKLVEKSMHGGFSGFKSAGVLDLDVLYRLAESYDPEAYQKNEDYMLEGCVDAILALPALKYSLDSLRYALPHFRGAFERDPMAGEFYELLESGIYKDMLSRLLVARKSMRLPKLPLSITTSATDHNWTFSVSQRYGMSDELVIFQSGSNYEEQAELLRGFVMYDVFESVLPKALLRFSNQSRGEVLFDTLDELTKAFKEVDDFFDGLNSEAA